MQEAVQTPPKKSRGRGSGCLWAVLLIPASIILILWGGLYLCFSPSPWKTVISEVEVPGHGKLELGHGHGGDISYIFYIRLRGPDSTCPEWREIGGTVDPGTGSSFTSSTPDGRFWCVGAHRLIDYSQRDLGPSETAFAILDTKTGRIWPGEELDQDRFFWTKAWSALRRANPNLPDLLI